MQIKIYLKVLFEETCSFHVDTHGSEYNGKVVVWVIQNRFSRDLYQASLTTDLGSNLNQNVRFRTMRFSFISQQSCYIFSLRAGIHLIVWQSSSWENRNLLTTSNGVHHINGRNTSLNHFLRVNTRPRVDGLSCTSSNIKLMK